MAPTKSSAKKSSKKEIVTPEETPVVANDAEAPRLQ